MPETAKHTTLPVRITFAENADGTFTVNTAIEGMECADMALAAIQHMERLMQGNGIKRMACFEVEIVL